MTLGAFFPRRVTTEKCHPNVPTAACAWRREAEMLGRMRYDRIVNGWVLFGDKAYVRRMTNSKKLLKWQKIQRIGYDTTGDLLILELCPGCKSELPDGDGDEPE